MNITIKLEIGKNYCRYERKLLCNRYKGLTIEQKKWKFTNFHFWRWDKKYVAISKEL